MSTDRLHFIYMPAYARFLLDHKLDEFVRTQLQLSRDAQIPLLKFFSGMSDEELIRIGTASMKELLEAFENNTVNELIERSVQSWINNQLPILGRDQILAEDITSISIIRRKTFRIFLPSYTTDITARFQLMDEIDLYTAEQENRSFNTFLSLQNQEIQSVNETLLARNKELAEAQEIAVMGSFEWNLVTGTNTMSPSVLKIFELTGKSNLELFMQWVHPDDRDKVKAAIEKSFQIDDGIYECEYRYQKSGPQKVLWSRGIVTFEDGKPIKMTGMVMDVTDRYTMLIRLQESEKLYKQAQSLTHIGNWSWNIQENTVSWSDEMYRIYGMEPQSEDITLEKFSTFVHPDDREKRLKEIKEALDTLQVSEYYMRIIAADGQVKTLRGRGEIVADKNGVPTHMMGTCQDITTEYRLNQELKEREESLVQLNHFLEQKNLELEKKNHELESFNYAISHDLQEPLRKIQVFSSMLKEGQGNIKKEGQDAVIDKINTSATRLRNLISDLFSFSFLLPSENQDGETADLNMIIEDVLNDYQLLLAEKKVDIQVRPLPVIAARTTLLYQLFQNLVSNAIKYSRENTIPQVIISSEIHHGSALANIPGIDTQRKYQVITVEDNGIGLDEKYSVKIFDLFQRLHTKKDYSGTGIGLAMCKKIMDYYNGFIAVKSVPGKGSRFMVYFPL